MKMSPLKHADFAAAVLLALGLALRLGCTSPSGHGSAAADSPAAASQALFHPDPENIWNRLYSAVYLRRTADGRDHGHDEIDPPLWPDSAHLLADPKHAQALQALDQFLATRAEAHVRDPLKRAILQHDLWAVFDWLVSRPPDQQAKARELSTRLAAVLRRVALTREEIAHLPDNYSAAVASGAVATQHDPRQRGMPFLPDRLLDQNGPWVTVAVGDLSTTPLHSHFVGGRSHFLVSSSPGRPVGDAGLCEPPAGSPGPAQLRRPSGPSSVSTGNTGGPAAAHDSH